VPRLEEEEGRRTSRRSARASAVGAAAAAPTPSSSLQSTALDPASPFTMPGAGAGNAGGWVVRISRGACARELSAPNPDPPTC
jgi:hypothetical protein